jgi:hypothetical protein
MPYLHWQSELKKDPGYYFESEKWNLPDIFLDYFQRRWQIEKEKMINTEKEKLEYKDFLYAPSMVKNKCFSLYDDPNADH